MSEFLTGLRAYWDAWRLVWRGRLWPYLLVPGLVSMLYFPLMAFVAVHYGNRSAGYIRDHWLPEFLKQKLFVGMVTVGLWLLGLYLGFILFRNVIMILYAPVLGFISGKTEEKSQPGTPVPIPAGGNVRAAIRGITVSLLSLVLALGSLVICCLLLVVPLIGQLAMAVLLPLIQMFLAGHGFLDPALERRSFGVRASFRFAWRYRMRVLGCGCGFVLLSLVPGIGWFLGPTLGVVAGTLVALKLFPKPKFG